MSKLEQTKTHHIFTSGYIKKEDCDLSITKFDFNGSFSSILQMIKTIEALIFFNIHILFLRIFHLIR